MDPSVTPTNNLSSTVPRGAGSQNLERIFNDLGLSDRAKILDKLHKMRTKAVDKWGNEDPSKPHIAGS